MAVQLQIRRDTATDLALTTPALAEPGWDITNKRFLGGDASTVGGIIFPNWMDLQQDKFNYASAGGTGNALTVSTAINPSSLVSGLRVRVKATAGNTGAATLQWGSTSATSIKKYSSGSKIALVSGDIISGRIYTLDYDGTDYVVSSGIDSGGGLVLLSTSTPSGAASVDITSVISSSYNNYRVIIEGLMPATDNTTLRMRTDSSNGASFDTGASDYGFIYTVKTTTTPADTNTANAGASAIDVAPNVPNNSDRAINGFIDLYNLNNTAINKYMKWAFIGMDNGGLLRSVYGDGCRASTSAINAIKLYMSSGNVSATSIKVYGFA